MMCSLRVCATIALLLFSYQITWAEESQKILILTNQNKKQSRAVGEHYAKRRVISKTQILELKCSEKEEITRAEFNSSIAEPVKAYLSKHPEVLIVVPCWGVPLKIKDQDPKDNAAIKDGYLKGRDNASVDGEIALFRREGDALSAGIRNPFFNSPNQLTKD